MRSGIKTALALTIPLALTLVGCAKSPRDRLQGRWLGDSIDNVAAAELPKATGWVKGTAIEFAGNKVTVTIPAETPRTGTFKIAKVEGDQLTVSFVRDEGGHDDAEMALAVDGSLKWRIGGGREISLVKAKN